MHHAQGPGRKVRALFFVSSLAGGGEFTLQRGVGHLHPPFSFRLRRKENGPCTVQKKRRFAARNFPARENFWPKRGSRTNRDRHKFVRLHPGALCAGARQDVQAAIWNIGCRLVGTCWKGFINSPAAAPQVMISRWCDTILRRAQRPGPPSANHALLSLTECSNSWRV